MLLFVTAREKAVTFTEKKKPKAGLTFLSCCVYCFWGLLWRKLCNAWPSWMLSAVLVSPFAPLKSELSRLTERLINKEQMQNIHV